MFSIFTTMRILFFMFVRVFLGLCVGCIVITVRLFSSGFLFMCSAVFSVLCSFICVWFFFFLIVRRMFHVFTAMRILFLMFVRIFPSLAVPSFVVAVRLFSSSMRIGRMR